MPHPQLPLLLRLDHQQLQALPVLRVRRERKQLPLGGGLRPHLRRRHRERQERSGPESVAEIDPTGEQKQVGTVVGWCFDRHDSSFKISDLLFQNCRFIFANNFYHDYDDNDDDDNINHYLYDDFDDNNDFAAAR